MIAGMRRNGRDAPIPDLRALAPERRGSDPEPTFMAAPADRSVGCKADIRARILIGTG
jgi:hypothetical protein